MMEIKTLFDSNKNIYRTIEKVITYGVSQEAMETGGENEVGVWSPGFMVPGKAGTRRLRLGPPCLQHLAGKGAGQMP